jgi:transposase
MRKRRNYSKEFKLEAVQLSNESGVTVRQVAQELGIGESNLTRWRRELRAEGSKAFRGQGHVKDEEMMRLKRELARVRKERDFLKVAAAYLCP